MDLEAMLIDILENAAAIEPREKNLLGEKYACKMVATTTVHVDTTPYCTKTSLSLHHWQRQVTLLAK